MNDKTRTKPIDAPEVAEKLYQPDIVMFFQEHNVIATCSACGHTTIAIHVDADGAATVFAQQAVEFDHVARTAMIKARNPNLLISTECQNCGYHRSYSYRMILDWKKKREAQYGR